MNRDSKPIAVAIVFAAVLLAGVLLFINQRDEDARRQARCDEIRHSIEVADLEEYLNDCS
jgi:hypothetical protein